MTSYPSSIADSFEDIKLRTITYPQDDFVSWYLPAAEVAAVFARGHLPYITLPDIRDVRPRIAVILAQEKHPARDEKDYSLHPDYASAIVASGGFPVFIAYDKVVEQLECIKPDGVLLIGGCFNSPRNWYLEPPVEDKDKRAQAYLQMLDYARQNHLPTLGICAGEQIIGGSLGAKLRRDINRDCDAAQSHKQGGYVLAHKVKVLPDTLLAQVVKKSELPVNTAHNEAIDNLHLGQCRIAALADDDTVEAIEPLAPWHKFVLGVQWHPERLLKLGDEASRQIFKTFVKAAADEL